MSFLTNHVGLNIDEDKLQLVEIVKKENQFILENVDEEFFDEPLLKSFKESKFIHILQNAFNEIDLRNPISSSQISISLPLNYFRYFEIPVDKNLTKKDLNEYINWEFSKLVPSEEKDNFSIQKVDMRSPNYHTAKRLLVFAIEKEYLKRIHKFCVRNNLSLKNIDNSHIASSAFLQLNTFNLNQFSLFIESNVISFILFSNGSLNFFKSKKYLNLSEIPFLINSSLEEIGNRNLTKENIDKLFLSGNSISRELIKNIESSTDLSVELINPFSLITISPKLNETKFVTDYFSKFSPAAGMAFRLVS